MTPRKPTQAWSDAERLRVDRCQSSVVDIRKRLSAGKRLALAIQNLSPMSSRSHANAEALAKFLDEALSDYLEPLERSLEEEAAEQDNG